MPWNRTILPPSGCTTDRPAFSLVELLVVIAVIAMILSFVIPALGTSRAAATSLACLARLHDLGAAMSLASDRDRGYWPNLFKDDLNAPTATFSGRTTTWVIEYYSQPRYWCGPLVGVLWEEDDPADVWTCPSIMRYGYGLPRGRDTLLSEPPTGAFASYFYSAPLITSAALWDPDHQERWEDRDAYRRLVAVHEVAFPAAKGALAEVADFHGRAIRLASDPEVESLNALLCDGHAVRVRVSDAVPSLPTDDMFGGGNHRIPFLGTPDGFLGADLRGSR